MAAASSSDYKAALKHANSALAARERLLGESHQLTLASLRQVSVCAMPRHAATRTPGRVA